MNDELRNLFSTYWKSIIDTIQGIPNSRCMHKEEYLLTIKDIEKQKKLPYKKLRNKFYNSRACNKYNMQDIAGLACIDTKNPMKDKASLELVFVFEEA